MFPLKLYLYGFVFAGVAGVAGYGYYLYNQVDALEKEKSTMQATIEQKDAEMQNVLASLKSAKDELEVVRAQTSAIDAIAKKRQGDLDALSAKYKKLGTMIQGSTNPSEFNGQVNSEFTSVLSCIEKASGKVDSKCEM